jgi:hypothetical protein
LAKGRSDQLRDLHNAIGMFACELLLDGRAFGKCIQNNILHMARILGNPPSPVKRDSQAGYDVMESPPSGHSHILSYKKAGSWTGIVTENEPFAPSRRAMAEQ